MDILNQLALEMIRFDRGDARRIQHFTKVHAYARLIGELEGLDPETLLTLEAAAYVHDIGILPAEKQYGRSDGKIQEKVGPAYAEEMLGKLRFDKKLIDRVSYLVAHHHTYTNIEGADYQILVEADFLVNLHEKGCGEAEVRNVLERIFKTESGKMICRDMFGI